MGFNHQKTALKKSKRTRFLPGFAWPDDSPVSFSGRVQWRGVAQGFKHPCVSLYENGQKGLFDVPPPPF
jgi:hypothetical protein